MPRQKDYEILGRLIRDGKEIVLEPAGGNGLEGFYLGDGFISTLRDELNYYQDEEARILIAKLNIVNAKRTVASMEDDLAKLKKRVEPEAKTEEEGL